MNRDNWRELTVFGLLLAIGVLGRWAQPTWNFTPLAAVTVLGGFYFRHLLPAVLLPASILVVSDLLLPAHDNWPVLFSVHVMMIVPLVLGRWTRGTTGWKSAMRWTLCGVIPATAFYVVTNLAVWAFTGLYEKTFTGLIACYAAALPFYRAMFAGDVFYLAVLLSCLIFAQIASRVPATAVIKNRG